MSREITVKYWLDDATERKLVELCQEYCKVLGETSPEQLFQNIILTGSLIDANKKLDATRVMLNNTRQKMSQEPKYYDEENFVYADDGNIYDRNTGEAVGSYN